MSGEPPVPEPVIVGFANPGYCPWDSQALAEELKRLGARPVVVRVARRSVQVQSPEDVAGRVVEAGRRLWGAPLWGPSRPGGHGSVLSVPLLVHRLVLEERFWEAHEVSEDAWREGLTSLWPLAVATGALAKAQEGRLDSALGLVQQGILLGLRVPGAQVVDWGKLEAAVRDVAACQWRGLDWLFSPSWVWYGHDRAKPR